MSKQERIFNWQEAHARLERSRIALQTGSDLPQGEAARILKQRALALAVPSEGAAPATEMLQLLMFTLSGERFGIEAVHVQEVASLRELIPVPCTPNFVIGVIHYRGRILTVLDLRGLLSLPGKDMPESRSVISVEAGGITFGIVADSVVGTLSIPAHKVALPSAARSGLSLALTRGITDELMTILDLDALARAPEILVNDEVN